MSKEQENVEENIEREEEQKGLAVKDFSEMNKSAKSKQEVFTTIHDKKKLFNLETNCDYKLNDCKGEIIRVKDILKKRIIKPLDKPVYDEETGEILKENEYKMITILIDEQDKSYVTASKSFTIAFMRYIDMIGLEDIENGTLEIKITERKAKNSENKCLAFEIV